MELLHVYLLWTLPTVRQEIHRIFHGSKERSKGKKASDICVGLKVTRIFMSLDRPYGTHSLLSARNKESEGEET